MFRKEYKDLPFAKRMDRIGKQLKNRVASDKVLLCQRLQEDCDRDIINLKSTSMDEETRRPFISRVIDEKNKQIQLIEKHAKLAVKHYLSGVKQTTPTSYYQQLFDDLSRFKALSQAWLSPSLAEYIRSSSLAVIKSKFIEVEDLAAIVYLKMRLEGLNFKIATEHIVVDEAQDLSVFQLYVLRTLIKNSSMTILGDLCQGIHDYRGTTDWEEVMREVFEGRCKYLTLIQSYRTTVEIMEVANHVITPLAEGNVPLAKPVIRHGEQVGIHKTLGEKETTDAIAIRLDAYIQRGYTSIAIIGKTLMECKKLYHTLKNKHPGIHLITGKEQEYPSGIVIIPIYMAKGLEFDAVILSNVSDMAYPADALHRKLLYVAMTRPLHHLHLYYFGDITPLLANVDQVYHR